MENKKIVKQLIVILVIIVSCYYIFVVRKKCIQDIMTHLEIKKELNNELQNNSNTNVTKLYESFYNQHDETDDFDKQNNSNEQNNSNDQNNESNKSDANNLNKDKISKIELRNLERKTNFYPENIIRISNITNKEKYLSLPDDIDYETNNSLGVKFVKSSVKSGGSANKYIKGNFKLVKGLDGQDNTVSFLNMDFNRYLSRNSKGKVNADIVDMDNNVDKKRCSFHVMDGLYDKSKCTIKCVLIGKEKVNKYLMFDKISKKLVVEDNETKIVNNPKLVTFDFVTTDSNNSIFYIVPKTVEEIEKKEKKKENKVISIENFENYYGSVDFPTPDNKKMNAEEEKMYKNLFSKNSGLDFYTLVNINNNIYEDELADKLFDKLMAAKLDKDVKNLLDYNQARHDIFKKENGEFEEKINENINTNNEALRDLIRDLNVNRVKTMAGYLFHLENKYKNK